MSLKKGTLYKLGDGYINQGWNSRYCVLDGYSFKYYNDEEDTDVRGILNLKDSGVSQIYNLKDHEHSFSIKLTTDKVYHFSSDDPETAESWRQACLNAGKPPEEVKSLESILSEIMSKKKPNLPQKVPSQTNLADIGTPSDIIQKVINARRNFDKNWEPYYSDSGVQISVTGYQNYKCDLDEVKPKLARAGVVLIAMLLLCDSIGVTWIFGLVGFAFYYLKYYSSVEVLNRRFKYARAQTIIEENCQTVFDNFIGTNPRDWNPLITNMQVTNVTDEHNDTVSIEIKPQQD